ncbi:MAG: Ig-like domain-containing protein, partial [Gemmatimonadota bacterium]|nr:Ig-like domain-containing protein [Gemmatimonadota bacterium]
MFRRQFLLFLALAASALSCGRDITGPGGVGRVAAIALDPQFESVRLLGSGEVLGIGSVVPFQKVRVVLRRADGSVAVDTLVDFPPGQDAITLKFTVQLDPAAPSTGEPLSATMKYINAAGDTVFAGGPVTVVAKAATANNPPPPVEVPIGVYVGPGADAASIVIAPDSFVGVINAQTTFSAIVYSTSQQPLPSAPRAFTSTDSARVRVGLSSGVATLLGARGTALIIAQTLTGQSDTALVRITPTPTALVLVSGGNQQTLQGTPFPNPVRVRVNATDGLGVAGVTVNFAVTRGQGSVSAPSAVTDVAGEAQVNWIAGDSAGAAIMTASIPQTAISLAVGGQQISSAPASLAFSASPANFTAGATIPSFTVSVRDGAGGVVAGFNGNVVLSLTGGTAGATIVGTSTRAAVNGVATFPGLTIDRGGTAYRLVASVTGVPPAQSNAFDVAAAPASTITITSGAGQSAPPSTLLPDSIRVRVTDQFGFPKAGLTVQFAVVAGGGSVSPASATSNVDGRAATAWTIGAGGTQQMTVTVGALQPVAVSASVFTGGGTPVLFMGVDYVAAVVDGTKTVPIYLSPASGSALVAQLVMRDTLVAKWAVDSVIFTAGATTRSPAFTGRGVGSTYGVVSSSAGTDSLLVTVDSAGMILSGSNSNPNVVIGDTLRKLIRLSAPAPAGGLTVVARSDDPTAVLVAPGEGLGAPADPCDIYCYDLRVADGVKLLAPPAESAVVFIPAGQLSGQLVVLPIGQSAGMTVTLEAPGYAGTSAPFAVEQGTLALYSYYSNLYDPLPVGHQNRIQIQPSRPVSRDIPIRFTSRVPAVARVDTLVTLPRDPSGYGYSYYDYLGVVAGVSPGQSWVVYQAPGFRTDSFQVNIVAPYVVQL